MTWTIEEGPEGLKPSMIADGSGRLHMAYFSGDSLIYGLWNGNSWSVEDTGRSGNDLHNPSIYVAAGGVPYILFAGSSQVYYAWKGGSGWSSDTITDSNAHYGGSIPSSGRGIVVDSRGNVHAMYNAYSGLQYSEYYTYHWSSSRGNERIEPAAFFPQLSMAVQSSGYPAMVMHKMDPDEQTSSGLPVKDWLNYLEYTGTSWRSTTLKQDTSDLYPLGSFNSIAVDSSGTTHISYSSALGGEGSDNYGLWYGKKSTSAWSYARIDGAQASGMYNSIAVDGSGNPHISYMDDDRTELRYAGVVGGQWVMSTICSGLEDAGYGTQIAVDGSNNVHIVFTDGDTIKHAMVQIPGGGGDAIADPDAEPLPQFDYFHYIKDPSGDVAISAEAESWFTPSEQLRNSIDLVSAGVFADQSYVYMEASFREPAAPACWNTLVFSFDFDFDGVGDLIPTANYDLYSATASANGVSIYVDYDSNAQSGAYKLTMGMLRSSFPDDFNAMRWIVYGKAGDDANNDNNHVFDVHPQQTDFSNPTWVQQGSMSAGDVYYEATLSCQSILEIKDGSGSLGRRLERVSGGYVASNLIQTLDGEEIGYDATGTKTYFVRGSSNTQFIVHTPADGDVFNLNVRRMTRNGIETLEARDIVGTAGQSYAFSCNWNGDATTATVKIDTNGDGTFNTQATSTTSVMGNQRLQSATPIPLASSGSTGGDNTMLIILLVVVALVALLLLVKKGIIKMPQGKGGGRQQYPQRPQHPAQTQPLQQGRQPPQGPHSPPPHYPPQPAYPPQHPPKPPHQSYPPQTPPNAYTQPSPPIYPPRQNMNRRQQDMEKEMDDDLI
ncbi:MAG: hypothetical protein QCI38_05460 [Candidatus Thermoplasmatota archaeon]|nr:hypothetical protein [Candidatus Thermoplasmatota archaeon]